MAIRIELESHLYDTSVFSEFEKLCQENDPDYGVRIRENEIRQSALDEIISIFISIESLSAIAMNLTSCLLYDVFKSYIVKLAKGTKSSKHFNSMKIESNGTKLIIENEKIPEQSIKDGLDAFVKIALAKDSSQLSVRERMLNNTIVFPNQETDEVEILQEIEYIRKHVANKSNHKEEKSGQTENAHAE